MHLVQPAARGLRQLYALSSDRLWFTLAVLVSLFIATELAEFLMARQMPLIQGGFGL